MSVSSFHNFFSLISVSQKWNIETMLTLPYLHNWQNFDKLKMNENRSQEYQSVDPEYVTGQNRILDQTILLFDFCTKS